MAGIGFRLQRILASNSYGSLAAAYGYSAIIASGPWMLSMLSLMGIGAFMAANSGAQGEAANPADIFGTVTTYVYAGSILLGGTIHQGVSRYISDRLYASEMEGILPAYLYSASIVMVLGLVCAGPWFVFSGLPAAEAFAAFLMFQSLSLTWLAMVFLSAAKGYGQIVGGFCGANAVGVILAVLGYRYFALTGVFAGYSLGQFLLAIWLSWRIFCEFPSYSPCERTLIAFLWKKRRLAVLGFVFNLGIWIDKFLVWHSPLGREVIGWFRCADTYDTCLFFAYLTTIPAMAIFLLRVETSFYKNYSVYFNAVTCGGDISAIEHGKEKISDSLKLSVERLLASQGIITLVLIVLAPWFAGFLGLSSADVPTLRWGLLAAFLQALLLFLLIFFLYFDWQIRALVLSTLFCCCNAAFTWLSIIQGEQYLGLGYLFALLLSLAAGVIMFERALDRLEFETFAKQQMGV